MTKFNLFWTKNFQNGSLTNDLFFWETRPHSSFNSNSTQTWLILSKKSKLRTRPYFQSSKIRKLRSRPYSKPTVTRSTHNSVKTSLAPLKPHSRHPWSRAKVATRFRTMTIRLIFTRVDSCMVQWQLQWILGCCSCRCNLNLQVFLDCTGGTYL